MPHSTLPPIDELICAALRGESPLWPWSGDTAATEAFLACAEAHGVSSLLHDRLHGGAWPQEVLEALRARTVQQAMWELRHQQVLTQTLSALHDVAVQPMLIKGTALAYSIYADPVLRTRGDTDLLVPIQTREQVHQALLSLGFERSLGVAGEFASYQANYARRAPEGGVHTLDLHWKINNSEVLSQLFTYDQLRHDAMPLPALGPHACGPSLVHSMLIACLHRATHRTNPYYVQGEAIRDPDRLIWLADVHLIAGRLTDRDWEALVALARQKGLHPEVREAIERTRACWNTKVPSSTFLALAAPGAAAATSIYLCSSKLKQQWLDFRAVKGLRNKAQLLREILFPAPEYMRARFGGGPAFLPWLYLRRAASGLAKRSAWAKPR